MPSGNYFLSVLVVKLKLEHAQANPNPTASIGTRKKFSHHTKMFIYDQLDLISILMLRLLQNISRGVIDWDIEASLHAIHLIEDDLDRI